MIYLLVTVRGMLSINVSAHGKRPGFLKKNFIDLALECDMQDVSIDSTIIKVHQAAGSKKKESIGKSRGGNTTKVHVAVDALGNPLKVKLTGGQVHDVTAAANLIADLKPDIIMADAAYDSDKLREQIASLGSTACIKPRRNRKVFISFDKEQYKERYLVECFFQKLKRYRRIATRYDKLAKRFLAFIHLACILIWLL